MSLVMIRKTIYEPREPDEDAEPKAIGLVEVTEKEIHLAMYGGVIYRNSLEGWAWSQVCVDGGLMRGPDPQS